MRAALLPDATRVTCYRVCDRRYPFLWATSDQPPGRWHGAGEGPVHYLATSAKGAWAELLRHEHITELDDLFDLEVSLWVVGALEPDGVPQLADDILRGDESSYPDCQAEARQLRANGATGLRAPSAALSSGRAEAYAVDAAGTYQVDAVPTWVFVLFGVHADAAMVGPAGMPAAEGHPEPGILGDIRHL